MFLNSHSTEGSVDWQESELFALEYKSSNERVLLFQGREMVLENMEYERYDFSGAGLEGVSLEYAVVSQSDFSEARLKNANRKDIIGYMAEFPLAVL